MDNLERIKELEAELSEAKRRAAWYLSTLKEATPDTSGAYRLAPVEGE